MDPKGDPLKIAPAGDPAIPVPAPTHTPNVQVTGGGPGVPGTPGAQTGAPQFPGRDPKWRPPSSWVSPALVFVLVLACIGAWVFPPGPNWIAAATLFGVFLLLLGKTMTTRALGILINERKIMSLSRFQMVVWTALIVSAYLAIVFVRVQSEGVKGEPLDVAIDWQLWALLGISTTSLIGSPLLNTSKQKKEPGKDKTEADKIAAKAAAAFGEGSATVNDNREGLLYGNSSIEDARFTDLFQGDELANAHLIDLGQVQMFFFTIIIAAAYAVQLFDFIAHEDLLAKDVSLPILPEGLLALMGISHAGYLGNKAIDRTPTSG
jgi:hypothetical protein